MISSKKILNSLPHVLKTIDLPNLGKKHQGKVRDFYLLKDKRVIVTTDRQSAFDVVLGFIPFKGTVLNQLAAFWFDKTKHIVPNHVVSVPDPNVLIAKSCEPILVEMVVRGYLTGTTTTSLWYPYEKGERVMYGIKFPDGMKKNQNLSSPVITPTTHEKSGVHDRVLTRQQIIKEKLVGPKLYKKMEEISLALFAYGTKLAKKQGMILVDTKYEFGLYDGKLTLMDEIHTPDSSRFWVAETYKNRLEKGLEPESYDKEFLRLWYVKNGYRGEGTPPPMPAELAVRLSRLYIGVFEKLTEKKFKAFDYPIEDRIKTNLQKAGVI